MKKLLVLALFVLIAAAGSFAQSNSTPTAQIALGTYQGTGKIAGGVHTMKVVVDIGNVMVHYTGANRCDVILEETETPNLYKEADTWDNGQVSPRSCKEKGFVFFVPGRGSVTYHWGANAEAAQAKPLPVALRKTK